MAAALRAAAAGQREAEASLTEQYADLIVAWIERRQIWPACAEQLLEEADLRLWNLASSSPDGAAISPPPLSAHAQIIAGCRPRSPLPSELEFSIDWLVRWAPRLMPDKSIRQEAFHLAICKTGETALLRPLLPGPGNQRFLRWLRERRTITSEMLVFGLALASANR